MKAAHSSVDSSGRLSSRSEEVEVSGRGRGIRAIDLPSVFSAPSDVQMLSLITALDLSRNEIQELSHLDSLRSLRRLNVSYNRIRSVCGLPLFVVQLNLAHNRMSNLDGVATLPHLEELDISFNRLTDFSSLTRQSTSMRVLCAEDNRIHSTIGLEHLSGLQILSLSNNFIEDLDELMFLPSTPSLQALQLEGNPVARVRSYREAVAQLQASVTTLDSAPLLRERTAPAIQAAPPPSTTRGGRLTPSAARHLLRASKSHNDSHCQDQSLHDSGAAPHASPAVSMVEADDANASLPSPLQAQRPPSRPSPGKAATPSSQRRPGEASALKASPAASPEQKSYASMMRATPAAKRPLGGHRSPSRAAGGATAREERDWLLRPRDTQQMDATVSQLHDSLVAKEQLEKHVQTLKQRVKVAESALTDSRRVVSEQLQELSRLRLEREALHKSESELLERLEKEKRSLRAQQAHHKGEVATLQDQYERMKTFYEAQLADSRRALASEQARCRALNSASEAQNIAKPPPSPPKAPAADDLAQQLKSWLYAEMAEEVSKAKEEALLHQIRASVEAEASLSQAGSSPERALDDERVAGVVRETLEAYMRAHQPTHVDAAHEVVSPPREGPAPHEPPTVMIAMPASMVAAERGGSSTRDERVLAAKGMLNDVAHLFE